MRTCRSNQKGRTLCESLRDIFGRNCHVGKSACYCPEQQAGGLYEEVTGWGILHLALAASDCKLRLSLARVGHSELQCIRTVWVAAVSRLTALAAARFAVMPFFRYNQSKTAGSIKVERSKFIRMMHQRSIPLARLADPMPMIRSRAFLLVRPKYRDIGVCCRRDRPEFSLGQLPLPQKWET